jgi:flagellar motor switch protein FliM
MSVVSEEVAIQILQDWKETLDCEPDPDQQKIVQRAVMAGRVSFDAELEEFSVQLRTPIELKNGDSITSLKIGEPDTSQLKSSMKVKDEFESSIRLVALVTGHPDDVIGRMKMRDLKTASSVLAFFE